MEGLRAELARSQQQVADMAAAQEEFLRAVSHDLRAPLRHMTSYGTLVREVLCDLPPEVVFIGPGSGQKEAFSATSPITSGLQELVMIFPGLIRTLLLDRGAFGVVDAV